MGYHYGQLVDDQQVKDTKTAIKTAYKSLRKNGYFCRSSFWCCQGCGCSAIEVRCEEKGIDVEKQLYVFYHKQDNDSLKRTGSCYLTWGGPTDGKDIKKAFEDAGLDVNWDGSEHTRFQVGLPVLPEASIRKLEKDIAKGK